MRSLAIAPVEIDSICSLVVAATGLRLVRAALDHLGLVQEECHVVAGFGTAAVVHSCACPEEPTTSLASILCLDVHHVVAMLGRSVPLRSPRCDVLLVQIQRDGTSASFLVITLIVHAASPVFSLQAVVDRCTTLARYCRAEHQIVICMLLLVCIVYLLGPHLFRLLPEQDQDV